MNFRASIVMLSEHMYSLVALANEDKLSDPIEMKMVRFSLKPFLPCEMKCIEESFASVHDVGFFMLYIISFRRQYRSTPLCPSRVLQFPSGVFAAEGFYVH